MRTSKADLVTELSGEIRAFQTAVDAFDEAAAERLDVNRTDLRCLDVLGVAGRLTAGQIADRMRLTTGSVTSMVDRLEGKGLARRTRDDHDRRRVYVELSAVAKRRIAEIYDVLIRDEAQRRLGRYTIEEISTVVHFLQDGRIVYADALATLRADQDT